MLPGARAWTCPVPSEAASAAAALERGGERGEALSFSRGRARWPRAGRRSAREDNPATAAVDKAGLTGPSARRWRLGPERLRRGQRGDLVVPSACALLGVMLAISAVVRAFT